MPNGVFSINKMQYFVFGFVFDPCFEISSLCPFYFYNHDYLDASHIFLRFLSFLNINCCSERSTNINWNRLSIKLGPRSNSNYYLLDLGTTQTVQGMLDQV